MASNHTEKYQLNQWVPTDPVLRADFNEDNAKIEAALAGLRELIINPTILNAILDQHTQDIKDLKARVIALEQ